MNVVEDVHTFGNTESGSTSRLGERSNDKTHTLFDATKFTSFPETCNSVARLLVMNSQPLYAYTKLSLLVNGSRYDLETKGVQIEDGSIYETYIMFHPHRI